jgi:hypothetical protein
MKPYKLALLPVVLALALAACAPNFPTAQPAAAPVDEGVTEPVESPTSAEPAASSTPADEPGGSVDPTDPPAGPTDTAIPVQNTEAAAETCPYTPDLHATNPATVSLASGEVQLVEFFAFW